MKYVAILFALAVACLIAAPAIGAADAKGNQSGDQDGMPIRDRSTGTKTGMVAVF